jgi:hypothetical protein
MIVGISEAVQNVKTGLNENQYPYRDHTIHRMHKLHERAGVRE